MDVSHERSVMLTGIGGQGIQLAARVLAEAAVAEGREAQLFGSYGGMMRGGNTDASVVIGDRPIGSPPVLGSTWSAIVAHGDYAAGTLERVEAAGLIVANSTVVDTADLVDSPGGADVVAVAATALATEAGGPVLTSLVLLGAYIGATGIVGLDGTRDAVAATLPDYRSQHVAASQEALAIGAAQTDLVRPAWTARAQASQKASGEQ